jgi:Cutinase
MQTIISIALITIFGSVYAVPVPQDTQATNITAISTDSHGSGGSSSSNPINSLLAGVGMVPIIGASVTAISDVLTTFEAGLAASLNVDTTQNGAAGCKDMTVIFARGTTESGNVGLLTGPPFFDALSAMIGADSMEVLGVDYPASIEGFLQGGDATGSQTM